MKGGKILTGIRDCYGKPIPYGALLDFIWWARGLAGEVELHYKARIRRRKGGDIFEFIEDDNGKKVHFTHRLNALCWCSDDLELLGR